jgi:selenocysteine lyase/cysteine desulfurase
MALDPATECRPHFPALKAHPDFIYADNAGGSAILDSCVENIRDYYTNAHVQIGGSYTASALCIQRLGEAADATARLLGAESRDEICFVHSTTQGLENLARAMEPTLLPDDEIIVTDTDHEGSSSSWRKLTVANIGPWVRLAERTKIKLKVWNVDTSTFTLPLSSLRSLLSKNTRLVAVTHCSNILGTLNPIKEIAAEVHAAGPRAQIVVDGVAYVPHRLPDVRDLDVDYYAFSYYKVLYVGDLG